MNDSFLAHSERPQVDLISRSALKKEFDDKCAYECAICKYAKDYAPCNLIDNAPTVEVPENTVNCVLTMFGKCSYNETGCSDCEIKDKIRKALNTRPQGYWIDKRLYNECSECKMGYMKSIDRKSVV